MLCPLFQAGIRGSVMADTNVCGLMVLHLLRVCMRFSPPDPVWQELDVFIFVSDQGHNLLREAAWTPQYSKQSDYKLPKWKDW